MQANVSITLIICGTAMAGMPVVLYTIGAPLRDGGFLVYAGLAAGMIAAGIIGPYLSRGHEPRRGFEPVMVKAPGDLKELVSSIASQIGATEAAVFAIKPHLFAEEGIDLLLHLRPDDSDPAAREQAVAAFRELVSNCIQCAKDGVIEIQPNVGKAKQYCLITLAQRDKLVTGAAAFIVHRNSEQEAHIALKRVQYVAGV